MAALIALSLFWPIVPVILATVIGLLWRRAAISPAWIVTWGAFALVLLLGIPSSASPGSNLAFAGSAVLAIVGAALYKLNSKLLAQALAAVLIGAFSYGAVDWTLSATGWQRIQTGERIWSGPDGWLTVQSTSAETFTIRRHWALSNSMGQLEVALRARSTGEHSKWSWRRSNPGTSLMPQGSMGAAVWTPAEPNEWISRSVGGLSSLDGRTFRASFEVYVLHESSGRVCGSLFVAIAGGGSRAQSNRCLSEERSEIGVTLNVEGDTDATQINFGLSGFPAGTSIVIADGRLEEVVGGATRPLGVPAPLGFAVRLGFEGRARQEYRFDLPGSETEYQLQFEVPANRLVRFWTDIAVEAGSKLELADFSVDTEGGRAAPSLRSARVNFGAPHANLAGHSLALTASILVAIGTRRMRLLAILLGPLVVGFTGSRAGFVALLGAVIVDLVWRFSNKSSAEASRRSWRLGVLFVLGSMLLVALIFGLLDGRIIAIDGLGASNRMEIYRTALEEIVRSGGQVGKELPGIGAMDEVTSGANHAHNLWLELWLRFGALGLLAVSVLTVGLLITMFRPERRRSGAVIAVCLLLANVFDFSLFYQGVLVPLSAWVATATDRMMGSPYSPVPASGEA